MAKTIFWIIVLIIIVGGAWLVYANWDSLSEGTDTTENGNSNNTSDEPRLVLERHQSPTGVSFQYKKGADGYVLEERAIDSTRTAIVLIDTDDYVDLVESIERGDAREGPPAITIEIYNNVNATSALSWLSSATTTNFQLRIGDHATTSVAGNSGVRYTWDGLYRGESIGVLKNSKGYVFSVTYLSPTDQIKNDFEELIRTVSMN